jgi:hypothetical protein
VCPTGQNTSSRESWVLKDNHDAERSKVVTGSGQRMSAKSPVLGDHRRVGKRFIPPFVATLGRLNPVTWIDTLLAEVLWLGMLNNDHGHRRGIQLAAALAKAVDRAMAPHTKVFALASAYSSIPCERWTEIIRLVRTDSFGELQRSLRPLVTLYPQSAFRGLWGGDPPQPFESDIRIMRTQVGTMVNRGGRPAMLAQANAVYIAGITEKLIFNQGSMLSNLEAITQYPDTDDSRMVGSAVRATILMLGRHTDEDERASTEWTRYFWQRGIEITSCDLGAVDDDG